jgi:hypothetical protein
MQSMEERHFDSFEYQLLQPIFGKKQVISDAGHGASLLAGYGPSLAARLAHAQRWRKGLLPGCVLGDC